MVTKSLQGWQVDNDGVLVQEWQVDDNDKFNFRSHDYDITIAFLFSVNSKKQLIV